MTTNPSSLDAAIELMTAISASKSNPSGNVELMHSGNKIVLPIINGQPMDCDTGIKWLERIRDQEEREMGIHHELSCSPMDGAVALQKAIKAIYGWSENVPTPGFFGSNPPVLVGVPTGPNDKVQVPMGRIQIPGIEGFLQTGIKTEPESAFIISGKVKKKHTYLVQKIVEKTEWFLRNESIYKGKAIKLAFNYLDEDGDQCRDYDPLVDAPQFMDVSQVKQDDLIFGKPVLDALSVGLFTPIKHSEACRSNGIPLKRGILLHGPYGTGKTMTAYTTAKMAQDNGWTFIYLDDVRDLKAGLQFAAHYAPAVIFAEDIDRAVNGDRSVEMDEILNTLDGIDTKGQEVITVLTTNHVENINPAMLRPGRLDTLVEVSPPDAEAAQRLVRLYARDLLAEDVSLERVGAALAGRIPAVIREVTERAKIAAISRIGSGDIAGHVLEADLISSANAMDVHVAMLTPRESEGSRTVSMKDIKVQIPAHLKMNGGKDARKSA